jgi:hypothetical protein
MIPGWLDRPAKSRPPPAVEEHRVDEGKADRLPPISLKAVVSFLPLIPTPCLIAANTHPVELLGVVLVTALGLTSLLLNGWAILDIWRRKASGYILAGLGILGALLVIDTEYGVYWVQEATSRRESVSHNLHQLGWAMFAYAEKHGNLPPQAVYGRDGRPLLSWRVLLLPYLEEEELYAGFRLDEPWDSPHNIALLPRMPRVFASPGYDVEPYTTFYQVFVGPGAAFEGTRGLRPDRDFPDGLAGTILATVAGDPVPWTKPSDLAVDEGEILPRLRRSGVLIFLEGDRGVGFHRA